jgi:hypothetical protein
MTELISPVLLRQIARLRQLACVSDLPAAAPCRQVPRMVWTIDATSGRPVAEWIMVDQRDELRN